MFRLELTTPRATYEPGDAIAAVARVTYLGPDPAIAVTTATASSCFQVEEVGGTRRMEVGAADLRVDEPGERPAAPVPFGKSGSPTDRPSQGFDQAWYEDPS